MIFKNNVIKNTRLLRLVAEIIPERAMCFILPNDVSLVEITKELTLLAFKTSINVYSN